jgi:ABC-type transport system involved in multi-copper enzyme maturation permease subunit
MIFLPVVQRELLVASRRSSTYWTRFAAVLVTLGVCVWVWLSAETYSSSAQRGKMLFYVISGLAFVYALLAGLHVTADCVSEEKREGTLGLLFLTDLKGYDVALGKLVAASIPTFYRLVAIFPILAVPLLMGGLTVHEVGRMTLVLANTLFFSLSAGLLISAISREQRKAAAGTFLLILLANAGPPAYGFFLSVKNNLNAIEPGFLIPSAACGFAYAFDAMYQTAPDRFWKSVAVSQGLIWSFLALASVLLPHTWQDKPAGKRHLHWRERWHHWAFGDSETRRQYRTKLLNVNAYYWLAARNRLKPAYVFAFLGAAAAVWLWCGLRYGSDMFSPGVFITTGILLHTVIRFWLASEAATTLAEDQKTGSLELVLSTPMSVQEIIDGQILALFRQFGIPVTLILMVDAAMLLSSVQLEPSDSRWWFLIWVFGIILFVVDLYALTWVSMWLGLVSKRASWAASGAIARILVLPWVIYLLLLTLTMFQPRSPEGEFFLVTWFGIGIGVDLYFLLWSRINLRGRLREIAAQRYQPASKRPWWKSVADSCL